MEGAGGRKKHGPKGSDATYLPAWLPSIRLLIVESVGETAMLVADPVERPDASAPCFLQLVLCCVN